jgi:hypothetical protein
MADTHETTGRKPRNGAAPQLRSGERLLTPKEAANSLRLSTSWLAKARMRGDGPPYTKLGRYSLSRERLNPMDELSSATVYKRALSGVVPGGGVNRR